MLLFMKGKYKDAATVDASNYIALNKEVKKISTSEELVIVKEMPKTVLVMGLNI